MPPPLPPAPPADVRPAPPERGALTVSAHLAGGASTWRDDPATYGGFTLGLRIARVFSVYVGASIGYAAVDQRLLTRLSVGVELGRTFAGRYRPRLFGAFVHQHEESMAAVAQEPFGAVLGIGSGIRHRAGAHFGAGLDVRVRDGQRAQLWVGPEVSAMALGYSSGPTWYVTAGVTLTLAVRLW